MSGIDYPLFGGMLRKTLKPGECYGFWEHYCRGFFAPCRDLEAEDLTFKSREKIQYVMSKILTKRRDRLLLKISGWPRIGLLSEVFEDAKFVHILRDGRAVANSIIDVSWWWGWRGPENWRLGPLSPTDREEWEKHNRSFIVLAGIYWKILVDAVERAKRHIPENSFIEIKYEHLCSDHLATFREIVRFCELEWTEGFERELKRFKLRNTNYKYKDELTPRQQTELEEVLQEPLKIHGYL
jgi:hypothetical protein